MRIYAPSIVLFGWALWWVTFGRALIVDVFWMTALSIATIIHADEELKRRSKGVDECDQDDHPRRRWSDSQGVARLRKRFIRQNWYHDLWLFIISAVVVLTVLQARDTAKKANDLAKRNQELIVRVRNEEIRRERDALSRRNESCKFFERQEIASIQRVIRTYDYLRGLPREEWGATLNQTIIRQLPSTYSEALSDRAPAYCGKPGVGLPDTGVRLPKKRLFKHMLER